MTPDPARPEGRPWGPARYPEPTWPPHTHWVSWVTRAWTLTLLACLTLSWTWNLAADRQAGVVQIVDIGFIALCVIGFVRSMVAFSVLSSEEGVRIRTSFRTRNCPWQRIESFETSVENVGAFIRPVLVVVTTDGRVRRFKEISGRLKNEGLDGAVDRLNAELAMARNRPEDANCSTGEA